MWHTRYVEDATMPITGEPANRRLTRELRRRITSGELSDGAQLPSTTALQTEYGVSRIVVRDAINALKADRLVIGQQGKGVFVAPATEWRTNDSPAGQSLADRLDALEARVEAIEGRAGRPAGT